METGYGRHRVWQRQSLVDTECSEFLLIQKFSKNYTFKKKFHCFQFLGHFENFQMLTLHLILNIIQSDTGSRRELVVRD